MDTWKPTEDKEFDQFMEQTVTPHLAELVRDTQTWMQAHGHNNGQDFAKVASTYADLLIMAMAVSTLLNGVENALKSQLAEAMRQQMEPFRRRGQDNG